MISWEQYIEAVPQSFNQTRLKSAFEWMLELHRNQRRKFEDEPYAIHPIRVSIICSHKGEEITIAALLHDILEKTNSSLEEISEKFGETVGALVLGVSKINGKTMSEAIDLVVKNTPNVITLRIADRIDNLLTKYKYLPENRKKEYLRENENLLSYVLKYSKYDLITSFLEASKANELKMAIFANNNHFRLINMEFETFMEQIPQGVDVALLKHAFEYGKRKHHGQKRKFSGLPYFVHPIGVALKLRSFDTEVIVAGLLHDVVEDTATTQEEIEQKFGHRVNTLVYGMTKTKKRGVLELLEEVSIEFPEVISVKLADRIDNMGDNFKNTGEKTREKYLSETPRIIELANKFGMTTFVPEIRAILEENRINTK